MWERRVCMSVLGCLCGWMLCLPTWSATVEEPTVVVMQSQDAWLENPLMMRDTMHRWRSAAGGEDWKRGTLEGLVLDGQGRLVLDPAGAAKRYPHRGSWTSEVLEEPGGMVELLPSWNLDCPPETGLKAFVRFSRSEAAGGGDVEKDWSPWLYLGSWGQTSGAGKRVVSYEGAEVAIDFLTLDRPARWFQLKVVLESFTTGAGAVSPAVRQVVAVAATQSAKQERGGDVEAGDVAGTRIELPVPYRSQQSNEPAVRSQTCSPTSLSMVMAHWGVDLSAQEVSERVFDREYGLFGNWHRAVAFASSRGLGGHLTYVREWSEVRRHLERGQPMIASIRFKEGEFPSNPMKQTAGHLIVVVGMTDTGDAIVHDPAFHEGGKQIVYQKNELARAWLGKGGVTYLIYPQSTNNNE